MYHFSSYTPVRLLTGENCIRANAPLLALGKKAFVVTGRHGADACGAMADVEAALQQNAIPYARFSEIIENPPAPLCHKAGALCRAEGCDFVIAIGGGSALDGAKAIAAYAANPDVLPEEIFDACRAPVPGLPLIAVPTTAGTGSEAVPYAVLTIRDGKKKKTFKSPYSWPKISFVDPRYTYTLSADTTISTALDALSHAIESYISPKATPDSEEAALYAAGEVWDVLFRQNPSAFSPADRARLSYAATAAGIAIGVTGTGFPHPLGYSLTLGYGIPHGKACAMFEGAYLEYNQLSPLGKASVQQLAQAIGATPEEMIARIPAKAGVSLHLSPAEQEACIDLVADAANYRNSPYVLSRGEMSDIYRRVVG